MGVTDKKSTSIVYFEKEGRENLVNVIRVLRRVFRKRPDLHGTKLVFFTAFGEGPALAYNALQDYDPEIIAVTFPPTFFVTRNEERLYPRIPEKLKAFFTGVGITVLTGRLPFDLMEGAEAHNQQVKLIRDVLTMFGGSFSLCIQAVLQACDMGAVSPGERVIATTGDCAALVSASTTDRFLSSEAGLSVHEVFCKPRNFTISRKRKDNPELKTAELFDAKPRLGSKRGPRQLPADSGARH